MFRVGLGYPWIASWVWIDVLTAGRNLYSIIRLGCFGGFAVFLHTFI
jgi:hypothetical protein